MKKIDTIFIIMPEGYIHSQCFFDVALAMREALGTLQNAPVVTTDASRTHGTTLVFGAHLLPGSGGSITDGDYIIYNTEQVRRGNQWIDAGYLDILRRYPVWDYSQQNVLALREGTCAAVHAPLGYSPSMSNIRRSESATLIGGGTSGPSRVDFAPWSGLAPATEDIDVLFIGSLTDRRAKVMDALRDSGISAVHAVAYGASRDRLIARAKIVLNIHCDPDSPFETFRVSHLLANGKYVISEEVNPEFYDTVPPDIHYVKYDYFAQACKAALADDQMRAASARMCQRDFFETSMKDNLTEALGGDAA